MIDDAKLRDAEAKASRAKLLLENELLVEAFKAIEDDCMAKWQATAAGEIYLREEMFRAIATIKRVRSHLVSIVSNGRAAKAELDRIYADQERKKRFGLL